MQQFKLQDVLVVHAKSNESVIYAVLAGMHEVHDYIENELIDKNITDKDITVTSWPAVIHIASRRASLLDRRFAETPFLFEKYTSEPTRRRKELQAQALAKLTIEERQALGYSGP